MALRREVRKLLEMLRTNAKRGRGRSAANVFLPAVTGVRDVHLTPGDVTGVGSWGTIVKALGVRE